LGSEAPTVLLHGYAELAKDGLVVDSIPVLQPVIAEALSVDLTVMMAPRAIDLPLLQFVRMVVRKPVGAAALPAYAAAPSPL